MEPVIKWSGSKRSQASSILEHFPKEIKTYYEPFLGGGSVMGALMNSEIQVGEYICSDINEDLINLWNEIKNNPDGVHKHYEKLWGELYDIKGVNHKKEYFYSIRKRLNEYHNPLDFMFVMRTCVNGMPRYNSKGGFNTSYHLNRDGIKPPSLKLIIEEWSNLLNENDVIFKTESYEEIDTNVGDFTYLDPPYFNTKGMYFGSIDVDIFTKWLKLQKGDWVLSYDGISGDVDNTYDLEKIYSKHAFLKSGNSSFKRTMTGDSSSMVYESLYIK